MSYGLLPSSTELSVLVTDATVIILALPLLGMLAAKLYPVFASMPPEQAIVVFGAIGGLSGLASQSVAGDLMAGLGRNVNVLELMPAVAASVLASAAATYILLPGNPVLPNPVTEWLSTWGSLPS